MEIAPSQLYELWKVKASVYALKTSKGIWETCVLPIIFVLGPAYITGFKPAVVCLGWVSYSLFFGATFIILKKTKEIKTRRFHANYAYPLTILLHNLYEASFLAIICTSVWTTAVLTLAEKLSLPVVGFSWLLFIAMLLVSILFAPKAINRIALDQPNRLDKYLPFVVVLFAILPGLGLLLGTLFSHGNQADFNFYLIVLLSFLITPLLLPIVVINFYQIVFMGLNEWPEIKRNGNKFLIGQEIHEPAN